MRKRSACVLLSGLILFLPPAIGSKLGMFAAGQDIGNVSHKGSVKYDRKHDIYTMTGAGANIWGTSDAFHFLYDQLNGDVTLTTNISWQGESAQPHRKAGIMIRQSLAPDAEFAAVLLHGDGSTALQFRETTGGTVKEVRSDVKSPAEIRLQRQGDQITIAAGADDDGLKTTGPLTLHFQDPIYIGFAVCAHDANATERRFSRIRKSARKRSTNEHQCRLGFLFSHSNPLTSQRALRNV